MPGLNPQIRNLPAKLLVSQWISAPWLDSGGRLAAIDITGDGFLHNMVRILVGTVVDVARGRLAPGAIGRVLASGDRRDGGVTAPAAGLYLEKVSMRTTTLRDLDANRVAFIAAKEQELGLTIHRKLTVDQQADMGTSFAPQGKAREWALSSNYTGPIWVHPTAWEYPPGAFRAGNGPA